MKKSILIVCSLAALCFTPVKAQKAWTLEECINYAYANNLQVKRQELNVEYYKNNHSQSYFNMLPDLNGQINYGKSDGKTIDNSSLIPRYVNEKYWSGNYGISSSVTLFGGFQIVNNIMKTKYDFLKSQSDLDKSKNDLALQLALAYLQVLFTKELTDVAKSKLDVTSLQAERTRKMLEVGNVAQGEYLQIKAQEANDKTSLITARNNMEIAYLDLTQLLDLDSTGGFDVVVPVNIDVELMAPLTPVNEIYNLSLTTMPQIKSAEFALKSTEKQLSMAYGKLSPSFYLTGNVSSSYSSIARDITDTLNLEYSFKEQKDDFFHKTLVFGVNIPIFNKLENKYAISNSQVQVMDTRYQLELSKMALYKEVQQAYADASAAQEKYNSSVEAVKYNEEAFKYTSQKLEVGLVNSVDYNVAQNNLIGATSSMLQAKYEYIFKLKILDLYMGKPIVL